MMAIFQFIDTINHFPSIRNSNSSNASVRQARCLVEGEMANNGENVYAFTVCPSGKNSRYRSHPSPPFPCQPPPSACALKTTWLTQPPSGRSDERRVGKQC